MSNDSLETNHCIRLKMLQSFFNTIEDMCKTCAVNDQVIDDDKD